MHHRIKIFLGNHNRIWNNKSQVIDTLYSLPPDQPVIIDTVYEGFSLQHYGVSDVLWEWVKKTNRNPASVKIDSPNQIEQIGLEFFRPQPISHFFDKKLVKYHREFESFTPKPKQFGYFVGKYTLDRNMIACDILEQWSDKFVVSVMSNKQTEKNFWDDKVHAVGSLDQSDVIDQWCPDKNTNQSLLSFYHMFEIELVAETFVYGNCFFPTEKTVRPIMGSKPFLVYGPKNYLKNLRKLGFKTFDTVWDETYDSYEGSERWSHMTALINDLTQQPYHSEKTSQQIQEIILYNYNLLQKVLHNPWISFQLPMK